MQRPKTPDQLLAEKQRREAREKLRGISQDFLRILEIKDVDNLSKTLDEAAANWQTSESQDGTERMREDLNWYDQNNHRINLYQIAGQHDGGWDEEETTPEKNEHLLALKRLDICLK